MYSAKKRGGRRLHELARRGEIVERAPVRVRVGGWELGSLEDGRLPFRVTCSAGTYVRVLAEDLGRQVGCPAHLESLRRVASGPLQVARASALEELERREDPLATPSWTPLDAIELPLPSVRLEDAAARLSFAHGRRLERPSWASDAPVEGEVAVQCAGALVGVAQVEAGALAPRVVLCAD